MARRIKRYDNRKLYDTEASCYVSLQDIADLVREGETVEVIDNSTGQDLTASTLTQIILEEGKRGQHVLPSDLLHMLLRRSGEALDHGFDQFRATVDDLMHTSMHRLRRLVQGPQAEELDALRSQLRNLEQQLATLLDAQSVNDHGESNGAEEKAAPRNAEASAEANASADATEEDAAADRRDGASGAS